MKRTLALLAMLAVLLLPLVLREPAVHLKPAEPEQVIPDWEARYYNEYKDRDKDCAYYESRQLPYVVGRFDNSVYFDWGTDAPWPGVDKDNFLVCWTLQRSLAPGLYRFHILTDDGMQFYINNQIIIDQWKDQVPTHYYADVIVPGNALEYILRVDYYDHLDKAVAKLWWESLDQYEHWKGEYFKNGTLSGGPAFTRNDVDIDFDWSLGAPGIGLSYDHFSVRWTRTLEFSGGYYRFYTQTDDGTRLYVDDNLVIDRWHDQAPTTYSADVYLSAGEHAVKMEYYESAGTASAKLWWEQW